MVKKRILRRKHTYWHQLAKFLILNGFKPTQIGKIIQDVFPQSDVNGRHVGAYKRRLIQDEDMIIPDRATMPLNEVKQMAFRLSIENTVVGFCGMSSCKSSHITARTRTVSPADVLDSPVSVD